MNNRIHIFPFATGTSASDVFGVKAGMQLSIEVQAAGFTLERLDQNGVWGTYDVSPATWPAGAGVLNVKNPPPGAYRIAGTGADEPVVVYQDNHGC